ncbi:metallophosphoesterase [Flavobacterium sp. JP2137]|uniref:metallophosphoesterase n=1 Tax=Flavobacterium sp. JP2137 TaxID=3414510 RepID=UPI003D2F9E1B
MRWIILILFFVLLEFYSYQALNNLTRNKWIIVAYALFTLLAIGTIAYGFLNYDRSTGQNKTLMMAIALILLLYMPKLIVTLFLLVEDSARLMLGISNYFVSPTKLSGDFLPERRKFVTQIALGVAAIPFLSIIHGIAVGRYKFRVIKQTVFFDDLPEAFDGFTFTHISDIHCGSFDDKEKIDHAIAVINDQESDLLLFTGDLVNSLAVEMDPWLETFNGIRKHAHGKFSVLGNHDYGEYVEWDTPAQKEANFQAIKDLHPKMDFRLLLNEQVWIEKDGARIALVGVENWGVKFKRVGDINRASKDLTTTDFKIVLSHDPSHWDAEVVNHPKNFQLMLAGHTHGAQFGIEIPGFFKWSPIQYVYKQWAGLYEKTGRFLYVNRGFGYHAYPGRVGIWPEITVFELKRRKK